MLKSAKKCSFKSERCLTSKRNDRSKLKKIMMTLAINLHPNLNNRLLRSKSRQKISQLEEIKARKQNGKHKVKRLDQPWEQPKQLSLLEVLAEEEFLFLLQKPMTIEQSASGVDASSMKQQQSVISHNANKNTKRTRWRWMGRQKRLLGEQVLTWQERREQRKVLSGNSESIYCSFNVCF